MNTCDCCKFWRRGGYFDRVPKDSDQEIVLRDPPDGPFNPHHIAVMTGESVMGLCLHPSIGSDYSEGWLKRGLTSERPDGVFAGCDESRGCLETGERFGCIHHRPA